MRYFILALLLVMPLASCGHKGKLKTPSQVEDEREKKERKAAKEEEKKKAEEEKQQPPKAPPAGN